MVLPARIENGRPGQAARVAEVDAIANINEGAYLTRTAANGDGAEDTLKLQLVSVGFSLPTTSPRPSGFASRLSQVACNAEDMALGHKQLQRVEQAWRRLESGLRMRPVYHWAVHRIPAGYETTGATFS